MLRLLLFGKKKGGVLLTWGGFLFQIPPLPGCVIGAHVPQNQGTWFPQEVSWRGDVGLIGTLEEKKVGRGNRLLGVKCCSRKGPKAKGEKPSKRCRKGMSFRTKGRRFVRSRGSGEKAQVEIGNRRSLAGSFQV